MRHRTFQTWGKKKNSRCSCCE